MEILIYFLSKFLPLLFLPLGIGLILLLIGLTFRWRWPLLVSVLLLWIFSLGIVNKTLWRWLEAPLQPIAVKDAPLASAIVVLSGGGRPSPNRDSLAKCCTSDRFFAGLELYRSGKAPRLLFTGGINPLRPSKLTEGQLYLKKAELLGIPPDAISTTPSVVNTAEEAVAIRMLLNDSSNVAQDSPRILLVTAAFHMHRAQLLFERQGLIVEPFPVNFYSRSVLNGALWSDPILWFPSASALEGSSRALREALGRLIYRIR